MDVSAAESLVLETLQRAASQNTDILKPAEQKLKEWEVEPGFYSVLLKIISNHSFDLNVRWLAVLFFKNGVDRYWRKSAPNAIKEDEKTSLRVGLMETFREPVNQVATQLAVLISKAARYDCPREWPELIPHLLAVIRSEDLLVQHRGLLTLHHVIKTLASKRLAGDRRLFQEMTTNVYSFVLNIWNTHIENFFSQVQASDSQCQASLEKALLSLRILRKLTVHGFKQPNECQDVVMFLTVVFDRAKSMLLCRKSLEGNKSFAFTELLEKFIIHLTKVLISVLEHHPFSYLNFIRPSLDFAVSYIFTPVGEGLLFERFIIQCLNLIKAILLCAEYRPPRSIELRDPSTLEAHRIKTEFFNSETLSGICRKLIVHYFLLTRDDLQLWDSDPESFATDEAGESWKYSLRPCTESVFLALFHEFRGVLSPVLLDLIQNNHHIVDPSDIEAILRKDAVYNAVGLAAFDLYDEVDFDQWFTTTLIEELKIKEPNYRVVRRRVAWLIGQWAGIKLSTDLRPALYGALLPLLQGEEDMAVRLTAAKALKNALDDFEFNADQFMEYLEPVFGLLFALLKESKECDTKMQVLYVLSFIVERVGLAIRPYSNSFIQYLPLLWEESSDHNMLRCAIVSTLVHLTKALVSESLSSFLYPVIQISTDIHQDSHVYLLEDGLELWLAVLENTSTASLQLVQLFKNMPPLLEYSSEYLRTCFYIIQAYILLSPEEFLKEYGELVMTSCTDMLSDMNSEATVMTMRMFETAIRANVSLAVPLSFHFLPKIFESIYCGVEYPMVMSMYLAISSRVLLFSMDIFCQVIEVAARRRDETSESFLDRFLEVWIDKMPLVTQHDRRKLLSLALTTLLTSQSRVVLDKFCGILLNVVETLNDIIYVDDIGMQIDSLMLNEQQTSHNISDFEDIEPELETEHDRRRKHLAETDPVYNIILRDYLQSQINNLRSQVGDVLFDQLVQTIDAETLQQARHYVIL